LSADGGQAAIDIISKDASIDLVLIDIAMPEINGVETLKSILNKRPTLSFLYMTGYVGHAHLDSSEHRVLNKPFTIAELAVKVEEALFSSERRQPPSKVVRMNTRSRAN
jgi:CheY-like chemotaxis protein